MGGLSKHFSTDEFRCPCCGQGMPDPELVSVLEDVRGHFGRAVVVTSGYRCPSRNAAIGGARASKHLQGQAADISVAGISADLVADYLDSQYPDRYGIGRYSTCTHIDVRGTRARWGRQSHKRAAA